MGQSKEEKKLQAALLDKKTGWPSMYHGLYISKTHEMLSSGKPDLRVSHGNWGQLDIELKHKTTGTRGLSTGLSVLQRLTIEAMNKAGMPAVALVWSEHDQKWFLTLDETQDTREGVLVYWVQPVYKRVPNLVDVYKQAKELLNARKYDSARFLPSLDR